MTDLVDRPWIFTTPFLAVGALIVGILSFSQIEPIFKFTAKEGISVFAVAYLQAQFIERMIELFNGASIFDKDKKEKARRESSIALTDAIALEERGLQNEAIEKKKEAIKKEKEVDEIDKKRVYIFWGIASLMGMILVFFTVSLFQTVGVDIDPKVPWPRFLDTVLSGVIVGAGTKPLHDVIQYIQKQKNKSEGQSGK